MKKYEKTIFFKERKIEISAECKFAFLFSKFTPEVLLIFLQLNIQTTLEVVTWIHC